MKLQHLAIIFVIIILPISLIMGEYIHSQIDTINNQALYNGKLYTATYDAVEALKLNAAHNNYSTLSDSKLRDIKAAVDTFYNSLGQQMSLDLYKKEDLSQFTPALLFNLYDGYYIYSKFYNEQESKYEYGLKPYIYYTCRYKKSSDTDFIVNYTLDNYITIYGKVKGSYVTKSGYLIDSSKVYRNGETVKYDGINIDKEKLSEIVFYEEGGIYKKTPNPINYVIYKNNKIYKDESGFFSINSKFQKQYYAGTMRNELINVFGNGELLSNSAQEYYKSAKEFSDWVNSNLSDIKQSHAVDPITGASINDFTTNIGNSSIFDCTTYNTYGETGITGTIFDIQRMEVIRKSITSNLISAIANFNYYTVSLSYDFVLPKFSEEDWYNITNNVTVISFMQGMSIGSKYYNDYCIVINNQNKELVNFNTLNVVTTDKQVHSIYCKDLIDQNLTIDKAYKTVDFERKYSITNPDNGDKKYYYLHENLRCYNCIIGPSQTYKINFLTGTIEEYNQFTEKYETKVFNSQENQRFIRLRKEVLQAIARERYDLYKINGYFGS